MNTEPDKTTELRGSKSQRTALLAALLTTEANHWALASNHNHLRSMWEKRITKETYDLTEKEAKAVAIAQAGALALAAQLIPLRAMQELCELMKLYTELRVTHGNS